MTKKQVFIGIIILLVVGVAGFVGYKMYLNKKAKNEKAEKMPVVSTVDINAWEIKEPTVEEPKPQVLPQGIFEVKKIDVDKSRIQSIHNALAN